MASRTMTRTTGLPSIVTGTPVAGTLPVFCVVKVNVNTSDGAALNFDTSLCSKMLAPRAVCTLSVTVRVALWAWLVAVKLTSADCPSGTVVLTSPSKTTSTYSPGAKVTVLLNAKTGSPGSATPLPLLSR